MLKKIRKIVVGFFMALVGIIKIVFHAIVPIWDSHTDGSVWFAILYQPFLVLTTELATI